MSELASYPVIYEQQVAWGDMDALGHVNNVQYYRYIESARISYMRALKFFEQDIHLVVASSQCKYLRPVTFPDQLNIGVRVEEIRSSAFRMSYLLWSTAQQQVVALGEAVMVSVDQENMQKTQLPECIKQRIVEIENTVQPNLNS